MKISKIEYKNYIEWQAQRYKYMEYIETPHKYKGGEIYISGAPTKRAIQVKVCYKNIGYCKIFDVPCDVLEYEEKTGSFLCRKIETRKMYTWRDAETYNLALEFGQGILDCLEMFENKTFSCEPIDCKFVEDETI